jgi:TolB-like protein
MNDRPDRSDRLESWKEIAAYLRRSVRTVRRWETEESLPVHRQMHRSLGSVYAYRSEIDRWQQRREGSAVPRVRRLPAVPHKDRSIAVLPFEYVGPDREHLYVADGFTEEVISRLSRIRTLRVISRTSSMACRGEGRDARTLGDTLGVRYLVEGTVRRSGERLKVSARLIDAVEDDRRWSEEYEGSLEDLFAIQEELARKVVDSLELRLTRGEQSSLRGRPLEDVVAWECLVQARQESLRWRRDAIDRAVQRLESGLAAVGPNAELYAALGRVHLQYREAGIDLGEEPLGLAESYAEEAFALDPESAAGLQLRGWVHYSRGEIQSAVDDLSSALLLDWSNADTLGILSNCLLISGRVEEARPLIERLLAIDPLTPLNRCLPGWADALEGNLASAIGPYRVMFEMDRDNPMARLFYAYILTLNRRADEVERLAAEFPHDLATGLPATVTALLAGALRGDAGAVLARLPDPGDRVSASTELFPRMIGQGLALMGRSGMALEWLRIAVARGFINFPFLERHDPCLEQLRGSLGFSDLLDEVRERWESFEVPESLR